jgi:hypothetical protein
MISDTALLTLKYTAGGIAGVYGIYATLADFHKEKNGRKILSRELATLGLCYYCSLPL